VIRWDEGSGSRIDNGELGDNAKNQWAVLMNLYSQVLKLINTYYQFFIVKLD
jgi:hypothetical protein